MIFTWWGVSLKLYILKKKKCKFTYHYTTLCSPFLSLCWLSTSLIFSVQLLNSWGRYLRGTNNTVWTEYFFCCFYFEKWSHCKSEKRFKSSETSQFHAHCPCKVWRWYQIFSPSYPLHLWCLLPPPPLVLLVRHSTPQTLSKLAIAGPPNWGKTLKESHYYKDPIFLSPLMLLLHFQQNVQAVNTERDIWSLSQKQPVAVLSKNPSFWDILDIHDMFLSAIY